MGSPPPGGSGQVRMIGVTPPLVTAANDPLRKEFENNFRSYVAIMKAFRSVWTQVVGLEDKDVLEIPQASNGGVPANLTVTKDTQEFANRVATFEKALFDMIMVAKGNKWIGPPGP